MTDTERLLWVMRGIDGFACLQSDKHDYAMHHADAHNREEPNADDELEGIRHMIDDAMKVEK